MADPLIIEVTRGREVESRHLVDIVAVDATGARLWARGAGERAVLPRSAIKPVQAAPVAAIEQDPERLALAASSHGGEPVHVDVARSWLVALGLGDAALECGAHRPTHGPSADALVAAGVAPTPVHNNCSGKHIGFLALCLANGLDPGGYIHPGHPLQRDHITPTVERFCGVGLAGQTPGVDGCGIPVWSMPLERLAAGWAALAGDPAGRSVFAAMVAHPDLVAPSDAACTRLTRAGGGRVVVKTGAEGVYCGLDRESGVAVALKVRDGATRAAVAAIEWAMAELGALPAGEPTVLHNWAGVAVGEIRPGGRS